MRTRAATAKMTTLARFVLPTAHRKRKKKREWKRRRSWGKRKRER